jgi:hypothetical protein
MCDLRVDGFVLAFEECVPAKPRDSSTSLYVK